MCCESECCRTHKCGCGEECKLCSDCGACYRVRQKQERLAKEKANKEKPKSEQTGSSEQKFFFKLGKGEKRRLSTTGQTKDSGKKHETSFSGSASAADPQMSRVIGSPEPLTPTAPFIGLLLTDPSGGTTPEAKAGTEHAQYGCIHHERTENNSEAKYNPSPRSEVTVGDNGTTARANGQNETHEPPPTYAQALSESLRDPIVTSQTRRCPLCKTHQCKSLDLPDGPDQPKGVARSLSCV